MERFILSISLIFVTAICLSQNITGVVTDKDGKPLYCAKVMIGGSIQSCTTDNDGRFAVKCRKGTQRIVITYSGYEPHDEKIAVDADINMGTIVMQPEYNPTDSLHVLDNISDQRTPMTSENYDHEYITTKNIVRDLPYILEQTPSFVALSENGLGIGFTDFRIRGMSSEATNVTLNGIQLTNAESRRVLWHHLPDLATSSDNIKITRGTGSSTNGSYAYGSSIDISTESPSAKPYGDLTVMSGSYNTIKASISAGTGIMKNGFSIDLRMAKIKSDGYIDRSGTNQNTVMISAIWRGKSNSLSANIIYGKQKSGITMWGCPANLLETNRRYNASGEYFDINGKKQYYDEAENFTQTHVQLIYSQKIWSNVELNIKLHYNRGDGYIEEYKNGQAFSSYMLPDLTLPVVVTDNETAFTTTATISKTDLIRRRMTTNNFYNGIVSATHKIGNFVNTFGASGYVYSGQYYGNLIWTQYASSSYKDYEWYRNKSNKAEFSAYYKAGYTIIDKITLYADLQYRAINHEMNGYDCNLLPSEQMMMLNEDNDYNFFNPKGGINYQITPKMRLYASVARTNREPSRNSIKDAVVNKKTIEPETLIDYELGYSYKSKIFSGELNLYYMDFENQIVPTGEFLQNGYYIMTNVDKSYRSGIELTARVTPHRKLNIEANATFSRNRIKDYVYLAQTYDEYLNENTEEFHTGETCPAYSPEIVAAGNISYNVFGNFHLYYNVKFIGKQYIDNTASNDRMLKPYSISSIGFDYEIVAKYVKSLRFKFEINNLFNTQFCDNAYGGLWYEQGAQKSWTIFFPQAGITFSGGVTISF